MAHHYTEKTLDGAKILIGILHKVQEQNNEYNNITLSYDKETQTYEITEG